MATRWLLHLRKTVFCWYILLFLCWLVSVLRGHHPLANPAAHAGWRKLFVLSLSSWDPKYTNGVCADCLVQSSSVVALTLAELHDLVLMSFIKFDKALTKFNKVLTNHSMIWYKFYYKLISFIILNIYTAQRILKSPWIFKNIILFCIKFICRSTWAGQFQGSLC